MAKKTSSKSSSSSDSAGLIKAIRSNTQKVYSSEQKILIVMEGIRGELSVSELCRKHGISQPTFYKLENPVQIDPVNQTNVTPCSKIRLTLLSKIKMTPLKCMST